MEESQEPLHVEPKHGELTWDFHPYSEFTPLPKLQEAMFEAQNRNAALTVDNFHLKPGTLAEAFGKDFFDWIVREKFHYIFTDSTSCTNGPPTDPNDPRSGEDHDGLEFKKELDDRSSESDFSPEWGAGLAWLEKRLCQEWYKTDGSMGSHGSCG